MSNLGENNVLPDYTDDFLKIEDFLENSYYEEAVERSFKILENCLDRLFVKVFTELKLDIQIQIINRLNEDFKGKKFEDLMIGEKLRIYEDFNLMSHLDIHLDKTVNTKILLKLNDTRKESTHQKRKITKGDATTSYSTILKFLEKIGCNTSDLKSKKTIKEQRIILSNTPERDYAEFIGREEEIEELKSLILHKKVHVLSVDGIGGVGKSALALELVYQLREGRYFDAIIWLSAKRDKLTYKGVIEIENTFVNLEDLFDEILKTFNETDFLKHGNFETKQNMALEILKENHCLIIVDNLETVEDENLVSFLIDINFPIESKVLITSRKRIGQVEYVVYLEKFSLEETRKYIQSQLKYRHFKGPCSEGLIREIHNKTGGIPLAIKVIIPWIIEGKIQDKIIGEIDKETDILKFCFNRVYRTFLSDGQRSLFCMISLAPFEIDECALRYISDLEEDKFNEAVNTLINYSLIYKSLDEKSSDEKFSMLPLTQEFGKKVASKDFPNLKEQINKSYLKYLQLVESEEYSSKRSMAVHMAKEARKLALSGDIEGAKSLFKVALGYDDECDYALHLCAAFCRTIQDSRRARSLIKKAINFNDKNTHYWLEYSMIEEGAGNFKEAEKVLEKSLEKIKNDRYLIHKLIIIKSKLQKNPAAIKLAKENIIRDTDNKKDKYTNTLYAIAITEGHWRISSKMSDLCKYDMASRELLDGISEIEKLLDANIIFHDNDKLNWQMKKTYRKLGDLTFTTDKSYLAEEYYSKENYYTNKIS